MPSLVLSLYLKVVFGCRWRLRGPRLTDSDQQGDAPPREHRVSAQEFSQRVDDPDSHRPERFAGQRERIMVEAIVDVRERVPCAVVRLVCEMLGFDAEGRLDRGEFTRQNVALADSVVNR